MPPARILRVLLATLVLVLGSALPRASAGTTAAEGGPVVLVGAPGLTWSDLSPGATPVIWDLATKGATGNLVVRGSYLTTCAADGWLSLGAGDRLAVPRPESPDVTGDPRQQPACGPVPAVDAGQVSGWSDIEGLTAERKQDATLGLLADSLRAVDDCVDARGDGAEVAAADARGEVGDGSGGCSIQLVDAGAVVDPGTPTGRELGVGDRASQVAGVEAAVRDAVASAPEGATIVVAGLGDDGGYARFHPVIVSGGTWAEPGMLGSTSTRRDDLVQLPDLTTDLLERAGAAPVGTTAGGSLTVLRSRDTADERVEALRAEAEQLYVADRVIPPFFWGLGIIVLAAVVLGSLAWWRWRATPRRGTVSLVLRAVALVGASVPAVTFMATRTGWWSSSRPTLALAGYTLVGAVVVAATALLLTRADPRRTLEAIGWVGVITAGYLVLDLLLTDGDGIFLSVLGLHPVDGGRFYGLGNVPFAIFVTAGMLAITAALDRVLAHGRRRVAVLVATGLGLAALTVVAAPFLGADGGGMLALVPAVGYLVLAVSGARVTLGRLALIGVATVVVFLGIAGLDYLRPEESRSHLGRFFGRILTGDAWDIIWRKLESNIDMLLGPERVALLVPVGLVVVIWALARPGSVLARPIAGPLAEHPALRPGLIALVIALTAGFLLNDSGTAIPAVAATILVPALAALALSAERSPDAGAAPTSPR